jgi:RHS repeat-associated protein
VPPSFLANSPLVSQIVFASNTTTRMTTAKQYDYLNRLSTISSTPSNSFAYQYNSANQRTMNYLWDGSYWRYGYDALGQVNAGNKFWVDKTPVAGQQFDYTFDTIGNRTQTEAGGDQNGANLRVAGYTNNSLNQITSRGVPGYVDVMGDGLATNGVTVNSSAAYQKNEYFREQLSAANTSAAVWDSVTVAATGQTSVTGHIFVPQTPETCTYDPDGNLLSDGRFNYSWDGENRLTNMTSLSTAPSGSQLQLAFAYDYMGRRIQKIVYTNYSGTYVGEYTNSFAYDGWNCLATLNYAGLLNSFMWGSDLSGSMQGAGGVAGLIEVSYYGAGTTNCFVALDGNGNVSALVNASNGVTVANYEYGPFGEVIRATGPMAKLNPFRFSTKYCDDETDLVYYGYRYYNPSTGRWLSKDPIGEKGGKNLYAFLRNHPISSVDRLGLDQSGGVNNFPVFSPSSCCALTGIPVGSANATPSKHGWEYAANVTIGINVAGPTGEGPGRGDEAPVLSIPIGARWLPGGEDVAPGILCRMAVSKCGQKCKACGQTWPVTWNPPANTYVYGTTWSTPVMTIAGTQQTDEDGNYLWTHASCSLSDSSAAQTACQGSIPSGVCNTTFAVVGN